MGGVVGVVRVGEWRLGAGSRHAGTGLLDARRRKTEDGRQKTPGRGTEKTAPGVNSRTDGPEKENLDCRQASIEYRTPTDTIGTGKEY